MEKVGVSADELKYEIQTHIVIAFLRFGNLYSHYVVR